MKDQVTSQPQMISSRSLNVYKDQTRGQPTFAAVKFDSRRRNETNKFRVRRNSKTTPIVSTRYTTCGWLLSDSRQRALPATAIKSLNTHHYGTPSFSSFTISHPLTRLSQIYSSDQRAITQTTTMAFPKICKLPFLILLQLLPFAFAQAPQVVQVGYQGLQFGPDTIYAGVGTQIEFQFLQPDHSVVEGSYDSACQPLGNSSFFSGANVAVVGFARIFFPCLLFSRLIWQRC
jgi:hypothetical protein